MCTPVVVHHKAPVNSDIEECVKLNPHFVNSPPRHTHHRNRHIAAHPDNTLPRIVPHTVVPVREQAATSGIPNKALRVINKTLIV